MDLVYVEFNDHGTGDGWRYLDDVPDVSKLNPCRAVGWVVKETKTLLVLANFINAGGTEGAQRIYIIKSSIVKRKKLHGYGLGPSKAATVST